MRRAALGLLVVMQVLFGLIAVSVFFVEEAERFENDANVLISSFGVGMVVFGLVLTLFGVRRDLMWAWVALWAWPLFLLSHVVGLGTVVPDLPFAVVFAAALLVVRPREQALAAP